MQITLKSEIDSIANCIRNGIQQFEEAGARLVALIDSQGAKVKESIIEAYPGLSVDVLDQFERIGRKQLYYQLCLNDSPGVRALRRCNYSDQVRYWSEPVPVVFAHMDRNEHLLVPVQSLDADQVRQVFTPKKIRSEGEQRNWLESQRQRVKPKTISKGAPYTVRNGKITFHEPCTLTVSDMARLLAEASQ